MEFSNRYIVGFALALCFICSLAVSVMAVGLSDRQQANKLLDMRVNILKVAGLIDPDSHPTPEEVNREFETIETVLLDRETGRILEEGDATTFDARKEARDTSKSEETPAPLGKLTQVARIPNRLVAYLVKTPGKEGVVLPIYGNGLWSTLLGYIALSDDHETVKGITYYEHGETPGLGGEVDNPAWKKLWHGKKAFDENGDVLVKVVKAGMVQDHSYQVDGMAGATITSNGVTYMLQLWLGPDGFKPFLDNLKRTEADS